MQPYDVTVLKQALAALNLGRFFIGIELNEEYCEIARRRVASHTAQQELKFA